MATPTKQDLIDELQSRIGEQFTEKKALTAEIDKTKESNIGLNSRLRVAKEKIGTLKDVARFYRAQRDRVDAYLSATIDAVDRQRKPYDYPCEVATDSKPSVMKAEPDRMQRPRIDEPFANRSGLGDEDGRRYAHYRDDEPKKNWEDF